MYYQLQRKSWLAKSSCFLLPFPMPLLSSSWHFPPAPSAEVQVLANKLGGPEPQGRQINTKVAVGMDLAFSTRSVSMSLGDEQTASSHPHHDFYHCKMLSVESRISTQNNVNVYQDFT